MMDFSVIVVADHFERTLSSLPVTVAPVAMPMAGADVDTETRPVAIVTVAVASVVTAVPMAFMTVTTPSHLLGGRGICFHIDSADIAQGSGRCRRCEQTQRQGNCRKRE